MSPIIAGLIGLFYSVFLGLGMTSGVKWLHRETPQAHQPLETFAWIVGAGFGCAIAARLSRRFGMAVGASCASASALVWLSILWFARENQDEVTGQTLFGHNLTVLETLVGLAVANIAVGVFMTWFGFQTIESEDWAGPLISLKSWNWIWLWIALATWVSVLPVLVYVVWLFVATSILSLRHPSLFFSEGASLFWAVPGAIAYFYGVQVTLQFLLNEEGRYKKTARFFAVLAGTGILVGVLSTLLLRVDIDHMQQLPKTVGSTGWWLL